MSLPITQGSGTRVISRASKGSTTALRAGLGAACFVVLAVLTGVGVLSYRSMLRVEEDQRWVGHTHLVLQKLDDVFVHLISAETSQRGYLPNSKKSYLSSRQLDLDNLRDDLKDIGRLTKDNPRQQQTLQQLERLISTQLSELQNEMTLAKGKG
jgi:CHASE3 domain sensor protein